MLYAEGQIYMKKIQNLLTRVGFEPTPFRTRTLIWRLRPTRPSRHGVLDVHVHLFVNSRASYYVILFYLM
jgi:hypothetical protein